MSLTTCSNCGGHVAVSSTACPHCGAAKNNYNGSVVKLAVWIVVAGLIANALGLFS